MRWTVQAGVDEKATPNFLLVFGAARSGTSWIGKIFDSHPLTLYKHEPDRVFPGVPMAPRLDQLEQLSVPVRHFVSQLPTIVRTQVAGSLPVFRKHYRSRFAQPIHRTSVLTAIAASSFHLTLPVLQMARLDTPGVLVVWKSIDSLGRLGLILRVMENCRAIRITRHPCASISSTLRGESKKQFSSAVPASEDYGIMRIFLEAAGRNRGLTLDLLRRLHPVERMAWIWVLMNEKALDDTIMIDRCMGVRYEDVCSDPPGTAKALFAFSGLAWNQQTSDFIRASTLGVQPGKFEQLTQDSRRYYGIFRDPIRSADKWKSETKPEDVERVYRVLRQSDLIRLYPESESMAAKHSECAIGS
jgi:hypothetical protein